MIFGHSYRRVYETHYHWGDSFLSKISLSRQGFFELYPPSKRRLLCDVSVVFAIYDPCSRKIRCYKRGFEGIAKNFSLPSLSKTTY